MSAIARVRRRRPGRWARAVATMAAAVGLAACGSSSTTGPSRTTAVPATAGPTTASPTTASPTTAAGPAAILQGSGPVTVLYAGSLVGLMEKRIGPGFHAASGFTVAGIPAGSSALASEIKGRTHQGDVFISASPEVNVTLEGPANGGWVAWYLTFASSPLLLGYNPKSRFAHDLTTRPWYQVLTEPGILVGRTDPVTDPKGKLSVEALTRAAAADRAPGLLGLTRSTSGVFPEETLVGRLQAGQLDAGFLYSSEARATGIPTVRLSGIGLQATYTATILAHAPHAAGAESFLLYLLGPAGRAALNAYGMTEIEPARLSGTGLPPVLAGLAAP